MTDYIKLTDFADKDTLPAGDAGKVIRGAEFEVEFDRIATAVNSKANLNNGNHTGTTTIASVDLNGGVIDNTVIGSTIPLAGTFTTLTATTVDINGGAIDDSVIGGTTAAEGTFTTANATTVDTTNIEVTNIKAKDGTASATIADSTGIITLDSSVLTTTAINGGTIDATTVGATTPSTGSFTDLTATGTVTLTSAILETGVSGTAVLDDDTFATASATTLATSESIKAYVDSGIAASGVPGITSASTSGTAIDISSSNLVGIGGSAVDYAGLSVTGRARATTGFYASEFKGDDDLTQTNSLTDSVNFASNGATNNSGTATSGAVTINTGTAVSNNASQATSGTIRIYTGTATSFAVDPEDPDGPSTAGKVYIQNETSKGIVVEHTGDVEIKGDVIVMSNLPTSDPFNAGQLWNQNGTLKVSAG